VQGEAGADLGDAAGAVGDDDELDDHEDEEDDDADDVVATNDEAAEGVDDGAGMGLEQDETAGGDVEAEPEEGHDQQQGGEDREVERLPGVEGDEQDGEALAMSITMRPS